jgi:hypothetical protein
MPFQFTLEDSVVTNLDFHDAVLRAPFNRSVADDLRKIDIQHTPASLDHWMVNGKGKYVGTWAKRLSKYVKDKYGYNINMEHLSVLAEHISKALSSATKPYIIEFTDHANWIAGKFADSNSCWFGGGTHNRTRQMMIDSGGGAICIYQEDSTPYGRLWYYPLDGGNFCAIFNIYDFDNKLTILGMARLLSMKFGVSYMRAHTLYFPNAYINGEGSAYLVGLQLVDRPVTLTFAQNPSKVEFLDGFSPLSSTAPEVVPVMRKRRFPDDDTWTCPECDEEFTDADDYRTIGDTKYCYNCLDNGNYSICHDCDDWVHDDNITYIEQEDHSVCENCLDNYRFCDDCQKYVDADNSRYVARVDKTICDNCYDRYYFNCEKCNEDDHLDNRVEVTGGRNVCQACIDDNFEECEHCNTFEETEDAADVLVAGETERWCDKCIHDNDVVVCDACDVRYYEEHDCAEADDDD